jgi:hypothetical protein
MSGLKGIGCSVLTSTAMLFGAIFTLLLVPAYGQQDVNPDWYDPAPSAAVAHPVQPAAAAHSLQPAVAAHHFQQTAISTSPVATVGKVHLKDAALKQSGNNTVDKTAGAQSGRLVACKERTALNRTQDACPAEDDVAYRPVDSVEESARLDPIGQR